MGAGEGAFRPAHLTARAEGRPRPAALGPILALATLWLLGTATVALGFPAYTTTFDAKYGTAGSALNNNCTVCHVSPTNGGPRNAYGLAFENQPGHSIPANVSAALTAIEGSDSDGDGFTNLTEINLRTFPGNAASKPVTLGVQKQGSGAGTVSGGGISCGSTCGIVVAPGTFVQLTASAGAGSVFAGWSGGGCGGTGGCNVTVSANTTIIATFNTAQVPLTVQKQGTGSGTVTGGGINCGGTCSVNVAQGTPVTLTAVASAGSFFAGWSGGGCTGTGTCNLTVNASTTVTAAFNASPLPVLTVQKQGTGSGTVTGGPISCGSSCTSPVVSGSGVTLTATPSPGSVFAGWSGGGCSGTGACNVTVNANVTVTATFNAVSATQLVASVLPTSRSVQVNTIATAFVTIINSGAHPALGVGIGLDTGIPALLGFQTTDSATNQVTGTPNTPVDIPAGGQQSFVIGILPTAAFTPTDVRFTFAGSNTAPVAPIVGVNTLLLSASAGPVPDVVALAGTVSGDGIVSIPSGGAAAFVVAAVNVGAPGTLTVTADTGGASPPVTVALCQTDPGTSLCAQPPAASVTLAIAAGATPTVGVFIQAHGAVPFDPASMRMFVRFSDGGGVRGATSVAIRTK